MSAPCQWRQIINGRLNVRIVRSTSRIITLSGQRMKDAWPLVEGFLLPTKLWLICFVWFCQLTTDLSIIVRCPSCSGHLSTSYWPTARFMASYGCLPQITLVGISHIVFVWREKRRLEREKAAGEFLTSSANLITKQINRSFASKEISRRNSSGIRGENKTN